LCVATSPLSRLHPPSKTYVRSQTLTDPRTVRNPFCPVDQRRLLGQPGQEPGSDRVELADVAECERPQERPQRRGCIRVCEDPTHPTVPQQGPCHRCCPRRPPSPPPARRPSTGRWRPCRWGR
jgi:hypothetical protein